MTVLHTRWPQPCGCVLSVAIDKHGTIHGVTIGEVCPLHGAAEALYEALLALLREAPDVESRVCIYARAREALARAATPSGSS